MSQALHPTPAPPAVLAQTREFWVTDEPEEALRKMKMTLNRVGQLAGVVPGQHLEGFIRFGVQNVEVKISWIEEDAATAMDRAVSTGNTAPKVNGTRWIVEATSEDKSGQAQRSAMERLEDAYLHFDAPDYTPDRLGVLPLTIIGILVAVLLFCVWFFTKPSVQKQLPNVPAPYLKDQNGNSTETPKKDDSTNSQDSTTTQ